MLSEKRDEAAATAFFKQAINTTNNSCNIIGSPAELTFEVQRLQLINQHPQEIILQKDKDITRLETIVELLKNKSAEI